MLLEDIFAKQCRCVKVEALIYSYFLWLIPQKLANSYCTELKVKRGCEPSSAIQDATPRDSSTRALRKLRSTSNNTKIATLELHADYTAASHNLMSD